MALDPRTPVLVGAGVACQREEDPGRAVEALELMARALEAAGRDAGVSGLLPRAGAVLVPRGFWSYPDPGRWLAERAGASPHTTVAEIGVLQTTLFGLAARSIADGEADVVVVAGGEARHRSLRAEIAGVELPETEQPGVEPDRVLRPQREIVHPVEVEHGLGLPVRQFSILENALRHADGQSIEEHRRSLAELWARMSRVAADNPHAWRREALGPDAIAETTPRNRRLAFPYHRVHSSQWNVDQAAALVFCSVATARSLGVPRDRWVFPLAIADSNHMLPVVARRDLHRSPGFALAGARALERARFGAADVRHLDLYSCFPVAVRIQCRELGIDEARSLTVTGGMAFAGGPLNNYVLQATARMAEVLRKDPGSAGMVNAVSGILTKQGVSLWSTEPPAAGFAFEDVTPEARSATAAASVGEASAGAARIASYTVPFDAPEPDRAVLVCDREDGSRCLLTSRDPALVRRALSEELCGRSLRIDGSGRAALS